jgi:hypothetical protein
MRKKIPDTIPAAATAAQATLLSSPGGNALNKAKPAPKPESNIARLQTILYSSGVPRTTSRHRPSSPTTRHGVVLWGVAFRFLTLGAAVAAAYYASRAADHAKRAALATEDAAKAVWDPVAVTRKPGEIEVAHTSSSIMPPPNSIRGWSPRNQDQKYRTIHRGAVEIFACINHRSVNNVLKTDSDAFYNKLWMYLGSIHPNEARQDSRAVSTWGEPQERIDRILRRTEEARTVPVTLERKDAFNRRHVIRHRLDDVGSPLEPVLDDGPEVGVLDLRLAYTGAYAIKDASDDDQSQEGA